MVSIPSNQTRVHLAAVNLSISREKPHPDYFHPIPKWCQTNACRLPAAQFVVLYVTFSRQQNRGSTWGYEIYVPPTEVYRI